MALKAALVLVAPPSRFHGSSTPSALASGSLGAAGQWVRCCLVGGACDAPRWLADVHPTAVLAPARDYCDRRVAPRPHQPDAAFLLGTAGLHWLGRCDSFALSASHRLPAAQKAGPRPLAFVQSNHRWRPILVRLRATARRF